MPWHGDFGDAEFTDPSPSFPFTAENGILRIEARKGGDGTWRSGLLCSNDAEGRALSVLRLLEMREAAARAGRLAGLLAHRRQRPECKG
jgi:hypothetical protein